MSERLPTVKVLFEIDTPKGPIRHGGSISAVSVTDLEELVSAELKLTLSLWQEFMSQIEPQKIKETRYVKTDHKNRKLLQNL